jgi:hypothetical protein
MAKLNADFAHMFGSDNDTVYLGLYTQGLATQLAAIDTLGKTIPTGLEDVGWLSDDGIEFSFDDSTEDIRGFQGNAVVKSYMSESTTSFTAALLESKLQTVLNYLDAEEAESTAEGVTRLKAKSARTAKTMCAVIDLYDTSNTEVQFRYVFPRLALGEREGLAFKNGEISAYNHTLKVLGDYYVITNASGMQSGQASGEEQ